MSVNTENILTKEVLKKLKATNKKMAELEKKRRAVEVEITEILTPILPELEKNNDLTGLVGLSNLMEYSSSRQFVFQSIYRVKKK